MKNNNYKSKNKFSDNAFTLAEVLIVLGIIGVIAESTIPTLISNFQEVSEKVSFKKAYSELSQTWEQIVDENPGVYTNKGGWGVLWPTGEYADYDVHDGRNLEVKNKMNIIKTCINQTGCWADNFESSDDSAFDIMQCRTKASDYSWITADGMCWSIPVGCDDVHINLDTNCAKKPNKIGQDIFSFLLGKDGKVYFAIDDRSQTGKPVSSGGVGPQMNDPAIINGRSVSFKSLLYK